MEPIKINLSKYFPDLHVLDAYAEIFELNRVFQQTRRRIDKPIAESVPQDVI